MLPQALLAYIHYFSFLLLVSMLVAELIIFRQNLSGRDRHLLQRADALYGLAAILVLITGFIRVFYLAKGSSYYFHNYLFLTKLGLFLIIGLLSIYPTVVFLKWRKLEVNSRLELSAGEYSRIQRLILTEVILAFIIPLLAAMMARGMGYYG